MPITREEATTIIRAAARAQQAAEESKAASADLSDVATQQKHVAAQAEKDYKGQLARMEHEAGIELRALSERVERAIAAAKAPASRPSIETRRLARKFLHHGLDDYNELVLICDSDPTFGELNGLNGTLHQTAHRWAKSQIEADALYAALDVIETKAWRVLIARAMVLAGEAES
jgi:hypothetical protein